MPQQLQLTVQPRLQAETWSLYWKETTKTSTDCLKSVEMSFDAEGATVANLMDQVSSSNCRLFGLLSFAVCQLQQNFTHLAAERWFYLS